MQPEFHHRVIATLERLLASDNPKFALRAAEIVLALEVIKSQLTRPKACLGSACGN